MKCKQCGFCCVYAEINLGEVTKDTEASRKDQAEWLALHRVDAFILEKNKKKYFILRIPQACVYLTSDRKTGKYKCKNYDKRPETCRQWKCSLMMGK